MESSYQNVSVNRSDVNKQLPWVEKYRPKKIDNIISHKEIVMSLKKFIEMRTLPHLLFFGPSGSGKTSTIKCCASEIYGAHMDCMILTLNASNERGIETVRTKIKNFVSSRNNIFLPVEYRNIFKLVILDEIDSMTVEAQGMLRQTIEKNSITTRFCLICNDIDKINLALQSRCALYRFAPLDQDDVVKQLIKICKLEGFNNCKRDAIEAINKISKGDMRAAINTLHHVKLASSGKVTVNDVYKIAGYSVPKINTDIFRLLTKLAKDNTKLVNYIELVTSMVFDNNITIFNLLEELKNIVINSKMSNRQKIFLIDNFALNEIYDSVNVDPKNIIMIICSLFMKSATIE